MRRELTFGLCLAVLSVVAVATAERPRTAAQLADLETLMATGADHFNAHDRLKAALCQRENDGLAWHTFRLLRDHQPTKPQIAYQFWWSELYGFLGERAKTFGATGELFDQLAPVGMTAFEHELVSLPATADGGHPGQPKIGTDFLLAYCRANTNSPVRIRLETLARQYAKIPPASRESWEDRLVHERIWYAWRISFDMGILRDGMPLAEAEKILGPPPHRDRKSVSWFHQSQMHVVPRLVGEPRGPPGEETVRFTNRDRLR